MRCTTEVMLGCTVSCKHEPNSAAAIVMHGDNAVMQGVVSVYHGTTQEWLRTCSDMPSAVRHAPKHSIPGLAG